MPVPAFFMSVLHRVDRREEQILRLHGARRVRGDARQHREAVRARVLLGRHDERRRRRRSAIDALPAVTVRSSGRVPLLANAGRSLRERLERRVAARALVGLDERRSLLPRDLHRHDLRRGTSPRRSRPPPSRASARRTHPASAARRSPSSPCTPRARPCARRRTSTRGRRGSRRRRASGRRTSRPSRMP